MREISGCKHAGGHEIRLGNRRITFDTTGDEEKPVVVFAQVARVQPAVFVDGFLRLVEHVEVTHEDMAAPEADLTVSLLVGAVQLCFTSWDLFTTTIGQKT